MCRTIMFRGIELFIIIYITFNTFKHFILHFFYVFELVLDDTDEFWFLALSAATFLSIFLVFQGAKALLY